jgi:ribosomal protein S18 acetylase RimI-like enzyme
MHSWKMNLDTPVTRHNIRRLGAMDAASYRDIRLDGLKTHPESFGAAWEDECRLDLADYRLRLEQNIVFGIEEIGSTPLVGVAGLHIPTGPKLRHKAVLWGMYVRPACRGSRLGTALLAKVLEQAELIAEDVTLAVAVKNKIAVQLYEKAGFRSYGIERRALKIDNQYYDEHLMSLSVRQSNAT